MKRNEILILSILCIFQLSEANSDGSCLSALGLGVIPNGGAATGYLTTLSLPGTPCELTVVTCINGVLSGPDLYPYCSDIMQGQDLH